MQWNNMSQYNRRGTQHSIMQSTEGTELFTVMCSLLLPISFEGALRQDYGEIMGTWLWIDGIFKTDKIAQEPFTFTQEFFLLWQSHLH